VTGINVYGPRRRDEWKQQLCSSAQMRAERLYDHLDFLLDQKGQAESDLLREARKHPVVRILETAPGFGGIRAARLVPIVVTPHRFRTKRQFWSYCGLGIAGQLRCPSASDAMRRRVTRSSSDWVQTSDGAWLKARVPQTRGLSRQHNHCLKSIFKGAATTVITQRNKDPIYSRYERIIDGGMGDAMRRLTSPAARARETEPREAQLGTHDRGHCAAHVEERGGVRSQTSRSGYEQTRRLGDSSEQRFDEEVISQHAVAKSVRKPRLAWPRGSASIIHLTDGLEPEGPTRKLCGRHRRLLRTSEEPNEAMASRQRPRWKDGSHDCVENTDANESRSDEIALEPRTCTEQLVNVPLLLERSYEPNVSTRDRIARTGADTRIEESAVNAKKRLALQPYGK
jgi:hypothetical protein